MTETGPLIALTGRARSGKDTVAKYITDFLPYKRVAFADPIKDALAKALGLTRDSIEALKEKGSVLVSIDNDVVQDISVRSLLQNYGLGCRELFGDNYWISTLEKSLGTEGMYPANIVIPDCRFENEADWALYNGFLIYVDRPYQRIRGTKENQHVSEQVEQLRDRCNYIIINDGTLDQLHAKTLEALRCLNLMK